MRLLVFMAAGALVLVSGLLTLFVIVTGDGLQ